MRHIPWSAFPDRVRREAPHGRWVVDGTEFVSPPAFFVVLPSDCVTCGVPAMFQCRKKGNDRLRNTIEPNSADSKTFSIIKNSYKYSPLLKSIKSKGITFQTTIEDLISIECWIIAEENGWLVKRNISNIVIDTTILDLKKDELNEHTLKENQFDSFEILLIINKINDAYKTQFCKLVCSYDNSALIPIKYLIEDVFEKLKIRTTA